MKIFSKFLVLVLFAVLLLSGVQKLDAAPTQNIWITVSISATVSVALTAGSLATTNWSILNTVFSKQTNRAVASVISNDGFVNERLALQVEHMGVLGLSGWTNSTTPANGNNIFVLQGLFGNTGSVLPPPANYAADDVITVNLQGCNSSVFANTGWGSHLQATNVAPEARRDLRLMLTVPSSGVSAPAAPTMRCIVSAYAL